MICKVTLTGSMKSHILEKIVLGTLLLTLSPPNADAAGFDIGPRRVASAWNVNRGALQLSTQGRFYTKRDIFTTDDGSASGITIWDTQLSAALTYGLLRNLQIDFAPILLQKTHIADEKSDSPGDMFFAAKLGLFSLSTRLRTAVRADVRLPTGRHHNIPLNPYSADTFGFGGAGLISLQLIGKTYERGLSLDANLGYFNHNDQGLLMTNSPSDTFRAPGSQELRTGAALRWMGEQYGFFTEAVMRTFLTPPPPTAYSRENSTVLSAGVLYQFNPYIRVTAGVDYLLAGQTDETLYDLDGALLTAKPWQTLPNYPDWRFNLGLSFHLAKGKPFDPKVKEKPKQPEEDQKDLIASTPAQAEEKTKKRARTKTTATGEETKIEITDVKELERRLRAQQEQGEETEQQRLERLERERERMENLLARLHERLQEKAAQKAAEEARRVQEAEEARRIKEAEEKAAEEARQAQEASTGDAEPEQNILKPEAEPGADTPQKSDQEENQTDEPRADDVGDSPPADDEPLADPESSSDAPESDPLSAEPE